MSIDDKVTISRRALEKLVEGCELDVIIHCLWCNRAVGGSEGPHNAACPVGQALAALRAAPVPDEDHAPQPHTLDLAAEVRALRSRVAALGQNDDLHDKRLHALEANNKNASLDNLRAMNALQEFYETASAAAESANRRCFTSSVTMPDEAGE